MNPPAGPTGGMDFGKLMKQAQQLQKQVSKVQEQLKEMVVEGTAGGGMVTVHVNGNQEVLSVKLDPEVVDPDDPAMLEDLVAAAVNQGLKKARQLAEKEMGKVTGGMGMPGLF